MGPGLNEPPVGDGGAFAQIIAALAVIIANINTVLVNLGLLQGDVDELPFTHIEATSDYNNPDVNEIQANLVYPIFEILVNAPNIEIYNYELATGDGVPTEAAGRVLVETLTGTAFEIVDMTVDLDLDVNGLVTRIGGANNAYFMLLIWDGAEWHYYPIGIDPGTGFQSNVLHYDASIVGPPAPAAANIAGLAELDDQIRQLYLHHISSDSRIIFAWYNDAAIGARTQLPWRLALRSINP